MSPTSRPGHDRDLRHLLGKPLQERDQLRMAPVAIAREPHHLPGLAVDRQRDAAGKAAVGVEADRARLHRHRLEPAREQFPGGSSSGRPDWRGAAAASDRPCPLSCASAGRDKTRTGTSASAAANRIGSSWRFESSPAPSSPFGRRCQEGTGSSRASREPTARASVAGPREGENIKENQEWQRLQQSKNAKPPR